MFHSFIEGWKLCSTLSLGSTDSILSYSILSGNVSNYVIVYPDPVLPTGQTWSLIVRGLFLISDFLLFCYDTWP